MASHRKMRGSQLQAAEEQVGGSQFDCISVGKKTASSTMGDSEWCLKGKATVLRKQAAWGTSADVQKQSNKVALHSRAACALHGTPHCHQWKWEWQVGSSPQNALVQVGGHGCPSPDTVQASPASLNSHNVAHSNFSIQHTGQGINSWLYFPENIWGQGELFSTTGI